MKPRNVPQEDSRQRWNKALPLRVNADNERNKRNHALIDIEQGQIVKEDRMCSQYCSHIEGWNHRLLSEAVMSSVAGFSVSCFFACDGPLELEHFHRDGDWLHQAGGDATRLINGDSYPSPFWLKPFRLKAFGSR